MLSSLPCRKRVGNCKWLEFVVVIIAVVVVVATGFCAEAISHILTLFKVHTHTDALTHAGWPLKKCFYCGPNMQISSYRADNFFSQQKLKHVHYVAAVAAARHA